MIANIVDGRTRRYRWKSVKAIAEPTFQDNGCKDSDQAEKLEEVCCIEELSECSLSDAVNWANAFDYPVTLYLYDHETQEEA